MFHQVVTLEADVQEPRAAAAEMSADLARLGLDNGALQQDSAGRGTRAVPGVPALFAPGGPA